MVLSHQTGVRIPVALPRSAPARARRIIATLVAGASLLCAANALAGPRGSRGTASGIPSNVERLDSLRGITEYRLRSNDLRILLAPSHAAPVATFLMVYRVGSRNEAPGGTGSAHLLEHLLFNKSTQNFGRARGNKTFQEILYEAGADYGSTNMTTWYDRMTGYSTLPSDRLELAIKIEADRMRRALLLDEERKLEMSVVINEYEIGENNSYRALDKAVMAAAIVAHPYHWPTIGYRSDLETVPTETLREHYERYFWPDNAVAVVVGEFEPAEALRLIDRQFGRFARAPHPIPVVRTVEPPQEGERRVVLRRPGEVGIVEIAYMRPQSLHPDFIPLDVLTTILATGVNARLYQALVETGLATDVDAWNYTLRDPYPLAVQATVSPSSTHEKVEAALKAALEQTAREGVTEEELARAKSQLEVSVIRARDGTYRLASALGEAVASADWKWFVTYTDSVAAVTAEDVRRVASTYLMPDHATVGWFVPEAPETPPAVGRSNALPEKRGGAGGAAPAARTGFGERTLSRTLENGLILTVVSNPTVPTVALYGIVLAGRCAAPPDEPGIPALTAAMLSRGTPGRSKRERGALLDGVGANLGYSNDIHETVISGSALARDWRLLLGVLADELRGPTFASDEIAKAKEELRADLLRGYDNTRRRAWDALSQLAYPEGHPYRAPERAVMLESLERAREADLAAFHRERYVGSATILSIVGDIDTAAVASAVDSLLGGLPRGERPVYDGSVATAGAPVRTAVTMKGKANMDLVLGHASGVRRTDPDWEAALVANAAIGQSSLTSRIGKRVRDTEGLSYTIFSRFLWADLLDGVWMVDVAVAPRNLARALRSTREEIERYVTEGITEAEVRTQKDFFAGNYQVNLGTNAGVASALTDASKYGFGPSYLDAFPGRVRAVTREEVNRLIRARLHPDKLNVVVAGDLETVPED